ncbi:MAG: M56 family metallopeptidase [Oscillospiraceae bacterium]|nr:M56 family metallopeptidase [Oscillospiraceae bacterium]
MLENLFINILEISITSAAAIAAILLISGLSENKFRKKWRYWVWVFLAVYLIVPFKIDFPEAPIKMEIPPHEMVITQKVEMPEPDLPFEYHEGSFAGEGENLSEIDPEAEIHTGTQKIEEEKKIYVYPVIYVAAVIWAVGAVIVCGWNIAMYIRFMTRSHPWNRKVADEDVLELFDSLKREMGIPKWVKLYENRLIKSPMMVGYFRPRVLLPAEALLPEEYEFVLRHELTHCKRGDIWYKFAMMLAASVHWFNPLVGRMCHYAENDMEITCDTAVVKAMAGDRRQEYCATILNIMRRGQNSPLLLSTSFYGGAKILKKRFSAVLEPRAHRGILLFIIAIMVIIISGTLVACKTVEVPKDEEPALNEQQEENILTAEEIAEEEAEKLISGIYNNKFNKFIEEDALAGMSFSKEAKKTIDEIQNGKTTLFSGEKKVKSKELSLKLDKKEIIANEKTVEIVFDVNFKYLSPNVDKEVESSHIMKIGYDTEKEEFTKILIFGYNWFENGKDKPEVTAPDENGFFPAISAADWDRWVTYNGEPQKVRPSEEIPSAAEFEKVFGYLNQEYPEIDDWEILFEHNEYVLRYSYDPYTYSYRNIYLPEWFVLLKTEQSEDFDRVFIKIAKEIDLSVVNDKKAGTGAYRPEEFFGYSVAEAFEKDIEAGNMKGAVILRNSAFEGWVGENIVWFPNRKKMISIASIGGKVSAFAVEGINEPLYCQKAQVAFGTRAVGGEEMEAPAGRAKDMFLTIDISEDKNFEKGGIAYYDFETKTVDIYENCVCEGIIEYPEVHYINSEIIVINSDGGLSFYRTAPHNIITEAFAQIGGNGKGLCEGKASDMKWILIDATKGGRYMAFYKNEDEGTYSIFTFDEKGSILSNFSTGLDSEGYIESVQYKSGVVYFSYRPDAKNPEGEINYAVDARPNGKQKLQANAW